MEFQTLKKSYKKQIIIGALAVCVIGGALTFNLTRAKYKVTESIPLVKGNVNYSVPDLRVVAIKTSEDGINYTDVSEVPASGYTLNTTNSVCKLATTDAKDNNITIEYSDGKVNFLGVSKRNTRCYLYFDKYTPPITIDDIIANAAKGSETPNFAKTSCSSGCEETTVGTYTVSDPLYSGTSTYWRGDVTDNYVKFANFCWRIVRINGDKTMRLIYDGTTCHANGTTTAESIAKTSIAYNPTFNAYYVGWTYSSAQRPSTSNPQTSGTASNAKTQLESWYSSNITGTNAAKVAQGKYCNDRDVTAAPSSWSGYVTTWSATGAKFAYAGPKRLYETYAPTLSCPSGDVYTLNVGLITMDETMYAGGKNANNTSYYLYNGQNYWTISPHSWNNSDGNAYVFYVTSGGILGARNVNWTDSGLRPVINLKTDITFQSGGNGTLNNPYVVS